MSLLATCGHRFSNQLLTCDFAYINNKHLATAQVHRINAQLLAVVTPAGMQITPQLLCRSLRRKEAPDIEPDPIVQAIED